MKTKDIIDYYGEPGSNQVYCKLAYPLRLSWDTSIYITRFSCHKDIQFKLEMIYKEIKSCYNKNEIKELGLDLFGGCLNIRRKRGSKELSLHSWGLAVDMDPVHNRLRWSSNKARFSRPEYDKYWSIVEKYGGVSLGRELNYDWMHFQFVGID